MLHSISTYEPQAWFLCLFFCKKALASRSFVIFLSRCEVSARVCWVYCMVLALANMEISGSPPGMTVGEYQPSELGYVFTYGFLLWLESVLALEVRLLELYWHGNAPFVSALSICHRLCSSNPWSDLLR